MFDLKICRSQNCLFAWNLFHLLGDTICKTKAI